MGQRLEARKKRHLSYAHSMEDRPVIHFGGCRLGEQGLVCCSVHQKTRTFLREGSRVRRTFGRLTSKGGAVRKKGHPVSGGFFLFTASRPSGPVSCRLTVFLCVAAMIQARSGQPRREFGPVMKRPYPGRVVFVPLKPGDVPAGTQATRDVGRKGISHIENMPA